MERDEILVLIAVVSAAVTTGGLIWQLMLYKLSGARLQVRLLPALIGESGQIVRSSGKPFDGLREDIRRGLEPLYVEAIEVVVTNVGRSPVSVSQIDLDVTTQRFTPKKRRRSIRPTPIDAFGSELAEQFRLDVGDFRSVLFEAWHVVDTIRTNDTDLVTVRGQAFRAGRRPTRSRWSKRLQLTGAGWSTRQGEGPSVERLAYRAFWSYRRFGEGGVHAVPLEWRLIASEVMAGAQAPKLKALIENELGTGESSPVSFARLSGCSAAARVVRKQEAASETADHEDGQPGPIGP